MWSGKRVLLGVSGSIAAYKAADILRRLMERGAEVRVVMTRNAARFVSPMTFAALSGRPVLADEFSDSGWGAMGHVSVTEGIDVVLVAPATANSIAKAATGIADDALSTALAAAACPVIMAPAMNDRMYGNPIARRNREILAQAGFRFVEPDEGLLACGVQGQGRLASTERILDAVAAVLSSSGTLAGRHILVTAGPTREPIDAVRFISNPSTGKMGFALARVARQRGARVTLVAGPTSLDAPQGTDLVSVTTAAEMRTAVLSRAASSDAVIMAAAVSDFRPSHAVDHKIRKEEAGTSIELERTADILLEAGARKGTTLLVGFSAETGDIVDRAREKLRRKNLDLIVANEIGQPGKGFGADTNSAILIDRDGSMLELPLMNKSDLAGRILDVVQQLLQRKG